MAKNKFQECKSCGAKISKGKKITCPQCGKVNKKPFYQRPLFIVVAVLFVISAIGGGSKDETDVKKADGQQVSTQVSSEVKTNEPVSEPIQPIVITVDELEDVLEENALKASTTYKGQYVELTGKLSNIDSSGSYFSLGRLDSKLSFKSVLCRIGKEHLDTVMDFGKEQEVTVVGTISDVGEVMGYTLKVETIK